MKKGKWFLTALFWVGCQGPNPDYVGDMGDALGGIRCKVGDPNEMDPSKFDGHFEGGSGEIPCIVRGCEEVGETCDPVSWTCDSEPGTDWKCVKDRVDLEECTSPVQCKSRECSPLKGGDGKVRVCGDGYRQCEASDKLLGCGQYPATDECKAPTNATLCKLSAACRSDAGCKSGLCRAADPTKGVMGFCDRN